MAEFLSSAAFAKAAHDGAVPLDTTVAKQFQADAHADDATRTVKFTITTGDVDRENDVVNPRGWEVAEYMKSPVVLWAHDYKALPIAKALDITAVGNGLVSTAQFPEKGIHPFADTVFELIKGGFIKAASVGFRPIDWAYNETRKGVDHKKQSLIEWSCVPVPANPSALVSARAAGIDVSVLKGWAEETLTAFKTLPELTPVEKAEAAAQARDEVGWKAYTKALARAQKKSGETPVTLAARADLLADYGFDDEAVVVRGAAEIGDNDKRSLINVAVTTKFGPNDMASGKYVYLVDVFDAFAIYRGLDGKVYRVPYALSADGTVLLGDTPEQVVAQYASLKEAEDAAVTKAGRVLSGANEARIKAAHDAVNTAHEHLTSAKGQMAECLASAQKPAADGEPDADDAKLLIFDADVVEKAAGEPVFYFEVDEIETKAEDQVFMVDTTSLGTVIRGAMLDVVQRETRAAINALRGRID